MFDLDYRLHHWLGRCLLPEGGEGSDALQSSLKKVVSDRRFDWQRLIAVAHRGFVASQLYVALKRRGLLVYVPAELRDHLEAFHALNTARSDHMREALFEAIALCNSLGVEPLLLKGSLALLPDALAEERVRIMCDLDILLPLDALEQCQGEMQRQLGYRAAEDGRPWERLHHAAPLMHPTQNCVVELHREPMPLRLRPLLAATDLWSWSVPVCVRNHRFRIPDATRRFAHTLIHAFKGHPDLRQLYDLALLRAKTLDSLDWDWLGRRLDREGGEYLLALASLGLRWFFCQKAISTSRIPLRERIRFARVVVALYHPRFADSATRVYKALRRTAFWNGRSCEGTRE